MRMASIWTNLGRSCKIRCLFSHRYSFSTLAQLTCLPELENPHTQVIMQGEARAVSKLCVRRRSVGISVLLL
jgi:hypothetical protein